MNSKIKTMTLIAIFSAITCILAPFSLPIGPVPISLTNLVLYFSVYIIGTKKASISFIIYLLLGLIGLPVFSGFSSGPAKLLGPTGGYLIGFILLIIFSGIFIDRFYQKWYLCFLGMFIGTALCYTLGTIWLAFIAHMNFKAALFAGVIPFIPGDLIKIIIALICAPIIKKTLIKANVI